MRTLKHLHFWVNKPHFILFENISVLIYMLNNNFMVGSQLYDFYSLVVKSHELARSSQLVNKNRTSEPLPLCNLYVFFQ